MPSEMILAPCSISRRFPEVIPGNVNLEFEIGKRGNLNLRCWVIDFGDGLGLDYAARWNRQNASAVIVTDLTGGGAERLPIGADSLMFEELDAATVSEGEQLAASTDWQLIIFLPESGGGDVVEQMIEKIVEQNGLHPPLAAVVVNPSSSRVGDDRPDSAENRLIERLSKLPTKVVLVRTGRIIDPENHRPPWRQFASAHRLVPENLQDSFLTPSDLFGRLDQIIDAEPKGAFRRVDLLGRRMAIRDVLSQMIHPCISVTISTALIGLLRWTMLGRLAAWILAQLGAGQGCWQRWRETAISPRSTQGLLALYQPWNREFVALAGYNTGVEHFGWKYPGKTVVRTAQSGKRIRIGEQMITVDAGILLKQAIAALAESNKEFYVVPNYSYVTLGTVFMVPIHGSGSDVSTLGETIEQALVYDPRVDRIIRLRRGTEEFARCLYQPASGVLVLRLRMRIRNRSRYFVKHGTLESPTASEIWETFFDRDAANIELRKSRASDSEIAVRKYYTTSSEDSTTLEIPRDAIGRIWDRIEENRLAAWMFHTFVRTCGFHVELFLDEREFEIFWEEHARLPLSKIQLRLVKCDGIVGSPFGDTDRISVDIFMKRSRRTALLTLLKEKLPHARFNPGKHSV